jgi:hypothetical protein
MLSAFRNGRGRPIKGVSSVRFTKGALRPRPAGALFHSTNQAAISAAFGFCRRRPGRCSPGARTRLTIRPGLLSHSVSLLMMRSPAENSFVSPQALQHRMRGKVLAKPRSPREQQISTRAYATKVASLTVFRHGGKGRGIVPFETKNRRSAFRAYKMQGR